MAQAKAPTTIDFSQPKPIPTPEVVLVSRQETATPDAVQKPAELARLLNDFAKYVAEATLPVRSVPLGDGIRYLKNVAFSAGQQKQVPHYLGRQFRWYIVCRVIANNAPRWREPSNAAMQDKFVTLVFDQDCTVDLWVG